MILVLFVAEVHAAQDDPIDADGLPGIEDPLEITQHGFQGCPKRIQARRSSLVSDMVTLLLR